MINEVQGSSNAKMLHMALPMVTAAPPSAALHRSSAASDCFTFCPSVACRSELSKTRPRGRAGVLVPAHLSVSQSRILRIVCQASDKERVTNMRQLQLHTTEVLAELLKAEDKEKAAEKYCEFLTEDFFTVASTYLELAKKEGNLQVMNQIETTLRTAMAAKEKTLRPEIRLLNQLMRDNGPSDRVETMKSYLEYLASDSYFFNLLNRMILDVERQKNNPQRLKLLTQLRIISRETKEASKAISKRMTESGNSQS